MGTLWDFSTSILSENIKKIEGGPLERNFFRKRSHNAEKTERADPLVSPGMVGYAGKQENELLKSCVVVSFRRVNTDIRSLRF